MRFLSALTNDIRYQVKYGFYFLYAFISTIYIAILILCPNEHKSKFASIIILTDPAMLGMFFIGGIWLLEKEEGLHRFWNVSPLRPLEYIISKAISLSIISTLAANVIALIGLGGKVNFLILTVCVFTGAFAFTIIGLTVASYARSVNQYMILATPPAFLLSTPPILAVFGLSHPILELLPGTALWRIIIRAIGISDKQEIWTWIILLIWAGFVLWLANQRIPKAVMQTDGGAKL